MYTDLRSAHGAASLAQNAGQQFSDLRAEKMASSHALLKGLTLEITSANSLPARKSVQTLPAEAEVVKRSLT